ncbi:MAG: DUF4116 domain-containing protein, partial [Alistipes sp.]
MITKLDSLYEQWLKVRVTYNSQEEALEAVKQNGLTLRYVTNQTEAICLAAVKQDGYALQWVKEQMFSTFK